MNYSSIKKIGLLIFLMGLTIACQNQKTGYVDTEELLTEYKEMKDTRERANLANQEIQGELDLKIKAYQIKEDLFRQNGPTMSRAKQEEKANELRAEVQQIQQEQQSRLGKLQVDSQRAIDSVITKVKDKVKAYGEQNGYTYIYGSNDAGSVLYGKEENDLTKIILEELNSTYSPDNK